MQPANSVPQKGPIPAGAGETSCAVEGSGGSRAYPRWRGGNATVTTSPGWRWGLSPLARGKPQGRLAPHFDIGPIPAGAGETGSAESSSQAVRAYPRWRGGNIRRSRETDSGRGLSPLARGKLLLSFLQKQRAGPIPAGAGETTTGCTNLILHRAYPRWRGGNMTQELLPIPVAGLSPLARGKQSSTSALPAASGPIPAGAGETSVFPKMPATIGAYPRWRGGNAAMARVAKVRQGLSPLARGKPALVNASVREIGPIPAGAGETRIANASSPHCGAYPRWRGGNTTTHADFKYLKGLSPLARGKHASKRNKLQ